MGPVLRKIAVARFTRTLGTLLASGVPILDAMRSSPRRPATSSSKSAIMYAPTEISEGKNMAEPLPETNVFPPMVVQMVGVGEQTGALDTMLSKIADFYEEEVDVAVAAMTSAHRADHDGRHRRHRRRRPHRHVPADLQHRRQDQGAIRPPLRARPVESDDRLSNRLAWVTGLRLGFLTLLLGATAFFYLRGALRQYPHSQTIVLGTIGAAFALAAVYAVTLRRGKNLRRVAEAQIVLDQLTWTAIVYVTGGATSGATSFYGLTCLVGAILIGLRGAALAAIVGGGAFSALCAAFALRWLAPPSDQARGKLRRRVGRHRLPARRQPPRHHRRHAARRVSGRAPPANGRPA